MNSDFSERQFETAVNIELTTALGPHMHPAVPVVPTTNQEAETGWDALFKLGSGYSYFLQYKIVTYASRRTSWNKAIWDVHRCPYRRFALHSNSQGECRQHRLLTELRVTQPGVYYCVPSFVREEELWERVRNGTVFAGSRLIDLMDVPLRDHSGTHTISFDDGGRVQVWSEPERQSVGDRSAEIRRREENRRELREEEVAGILLDAVAVVARSMGRHRDTLFFDAWMGARVPEEVHGFLRQVDDVEEPREMASTISRAVPGGDLLAAASRVLHLDFGLTWVIEPV
ncbi:MAG: hypothetical protein ACTHN7_11805 [Solirubrobacterales bacterium]